MNQVRASYGVPPLAAHAGLDAFAQTCAERGANTGVYSYSVTGPAGFGVWREHISVGYGSANALVDAWMSSSYHRAALLDPSYTAMGIGTAGDPADPWWCQELGG